MKASRTASLLTLAILGLLAVPASGDVVYETGFEAPLYSKDAPLDGQNGWVSLFSPTAAQVTTTNPFEGLQDVVVNGAALEDDTEFGIFVGDYQQNINFNAIANLTPIVTVKAAVMLDGPSTDQGNGTGDDLISANFLIGSTTDAGLGSFILSSNGNAYVFARGLAPYSFETKATLGVYHVFMATFNFATGDISYWMDNTLMGTNSIIGETGIGTLILDVQALDDGSVDPANYLAHYDSVSVTAVPEPSSLLLFGMGGLALLNLKRRRNAR